MAVRRTVWPGLGGLLSLLRIGPLLILAVLVLAMASAEPLFLTERNVQALLLQSAVVALLGIGQLMVTLAPGIDVSVGSIIGFSSVIGGLALIFSLGSGAGVLAAMLAAGAAVGFVNGFVFVKGRIPHPFIVTLATLSLVRGLALTISDGKIYTGLPPVVIYAISGLSAALAAIVTAGRTGVANPNAGSLAESTRSPR